MFKIDKSSVEYIDSNKSLVVVKHWMQQEIDGSSAVSHVILPEPQEIPAEQEDQRSAANIDAEQVLREAREEADLIISQAVEKSAEIRQSAWQEGYSNGIQDAIKQSEQTLQEEIANLRGIIQDFKEYERTIDGELEADIVELSLRIAEKITNIEMQKNDNIFREMVKRAVQRLNAKEKFVIRLNQREYEKYFSDGTRWLEEELQCAPCMAISDLSVAVGGCTLDSDEGIIKAGIDSQIKMIAHSMSHIMKQNAEAL